MNFNTIIIRFGFDPDSFINEDRDPIRTEKGFIYEVRQRTDTRKCPYCSSTDCIVQDHDTVEINCSETDQIKDVLRIIKTRFLCKGCRRTFTPAIEGISHHYKTSVQTLSMIYNDFFKMMTFTQIGHRYGYSTARIIQIFDEKIRFVPRGRMPEVLCIDEIHFEEDIDQKYCCCLYDFRERKLVDIIRNRQRAYLDEYFQEVPESERKGVRYFVSDMYDGYRSACKKFFPRALHIVDLFHVVALLTTAINSVRNGVCRKLSKNSSEYRFMKNHWRLFLCRRERIPDKWYTPKKSGASIHYSDMVHRCILQDQTLLEGYNILQDLFHYDYTSTFTESLAFIDHISERLSLSGSETLESVGRSYDKWRIEIADGIAKNQSEEHFSNSVAESVNNHLKTIIKTAYGYHNFERFRKRSILICRYEKL